MIAVRIIRLLVLQLTIVTVALSLGFSFDPEMEFEEGTKLSDDVCLSSRKFSNVLHKSLTSDTDENVINSPFSLHTILSLLLHGARNETKNELKTGIFLNETNLETGFKCLKYSLDKLKNVDLSVANAIYIQEDLHLEKEFVLIAGEIFGASVAHVDFKKATSAIERINTWVQEKTRNKIKDLITSDDINDDTLVIMLNAVYFKSFWKNKFDPQFTQKHIFYNINNKEKKVPMMYKSCNFSHGFLENLNSRVLEIPYENEDFSMTIILPDDVNGLRSLEENFEWDAISNAYLRNTKVELFLPKFTLEIKINLKDTLKKLGMSRMFENNADFSGISDTPLKVSQVVQKVFIEVNEEGSEAAAASGVQMRLRRSIDIDEPEEFRVDRPFLFAITYKPSNLPLFVGSIRDIGENTERDEL